MQNVFTVLLRAVNVSGKNIIQMASLRDLLTKKGFHHVQTYIQSGNIILESPYSKEKTKLTLQQSIKEQYNLEIDVFILSGDDLNSILKQNPFVPSLPHNRVFIALMDEVPDLELQKVFSTIDLGMEEYKIVHTVLYFYLPDGMAKSKLSNVLIEKKLKVRSTSRNLNTMLKLADWAQHNNQ